MRRFFGRRFFGSLLVIIGRQQILAHYQCTRFSSEMAAYNDPETWPKHWTATDIERLLRDNLSNPTSSPNYESLATLLRINDIKSLALLVRSFTKSPTPKTVDLEQNLRDNLNNMYDCAAMPLQERAPQLNALDSALSRQEDDTRNVACCTSPRGTGKTQFLKRFVFTKRAEAMKCGRVIVRCCDKTAHHSTSSKSRASWVSLILDDRTTSNQKAPDNIVARSTCEALCELIRTHVESVTGYSQAQSTYCNPKAAYATWMSETARFFGIPSSTKANMQPLIILDTCEILSEHDHKSLVHKSSGKPFSLLEAFCLAVPAPHRILVVGCNAAIKFSSATATVTDIGPLLPLGEDGYKNALAESWKYEADAVVRAPLFHLAGGVPRLLRLAHMKQPQTISLASGSINAFSRCFEVYSATARAQYPIQPAWFPQAYTCFLVSATKANVKASDIIPVNPVWKNPSITAAWDPGRTLMYSEAAMQSMGSYDPQRNRFLVAPITFSDVEVFKRHDAPILPSQLHPLLDASAITRTKHTDVDSWTLSSSLLYAVYARYLLAFWKNTNGGPWVPLQVVLEGAVPPADVPIVARYEVNLSCGVKLPTGRPSSAGRPMPGENAVTSLGGDDNHRCEAYIWCRPKNGPNCERQPIPLKLHIKCDTSPNKDKTKQMPIILVSADRQSGTYYDTITIDADAICSSSWLWSDTHSTVSPLLVAG
ncbi:Bodo-specific multi-copy gene family, putative [Bodo saltans]|uniref:Bodo-specific multi-copy gene family, putative n=1 Tax=Bodo saltans TaxID=75058 RepID=A0A0S4JCT4_BODSA|nr:Bodo-specific multi-copy gene family, putative [Bodo saltans]|eukprot:CUG89373.1 Bodo-specific multi-copy gene family, putative [Bodo saltans]